MKIALSELRTTLQQAIYKLGYKGNDADIIAEVLLYAQMRGNNQGIAKIATGGIPQATDLKPLTLVKENKIGALFSGGHSMIASTRAADKAIQLAQVHGVGIAAVNQTFTSSGAIGYFARRVAKSGFISIVMVGNGDWSAVAPAGAAEARLGTNPLAYAFPYDGGEVVFDTATAAIAYYGLIEAKLNNKALPEGVAINAAGQITTDVSEVLAKRPDENMQGAITTLAGHKGFGLSLLVQLMGSAFCLAGFPGGYTDDGAGTFIMALDPALLVSREEYMKRSLEFLNSVKSARPIPGLTVTLPGERGDRMAAEAERSGYLDIADGVWAELVAFIN